MSSTFSRREGIKLVSTTYTIQMASKLSGVGVHTIRAWEKRYKALVPIRDASGHRTYSKTDVEKLQLLSELCLLGYTISKVAPLSIPELKELLIDLGKSEESLEQADFNLVNEVKSSVDSSQSMAILTFALKSYKLDIISLELTKLKQTLSPRDFALDILLPLYRLKQECVSSGEYTSTHAEALRALLRFHLGHHLFHSPAKEKSKVHILISGMEGDLQDIELGIMGLLCSHYGLPYTYLGADISYEALSEVAKALEVSTVILGPTNVLAQLGKGHFQNYVEKLLMKLNPAVELIVAGKSELEMEKISSKRLNVFKSINAVDEHLSNIVY